MRLKSKQGKLLCCLGFVSLVLGVGCGQPPSQSATGPTYAEHQQSWAGSRFKADILFVVGNSAPSQEAKAKLARSIEGFYKSLTQGEVYTFQVGIITTDMDDIKQQGRLQGNPRIIKGTELTVEKMVESTKKTLENLPEGSAYEKGLEAMRAALSPELLQADNAGFLRPDAHLVVVFVTGVDDCSHAGKLPEGKLPAEVCGLPADVTLRDAQGNKRLDAEGNEIKGQMDTLYPVKSRYVNFLKGLKKRVMVTGLFGDPQVLHTLPGNTRPSPIEGCKDDSFCTLDGQEHICGYADVQGTRRCGGCKTGTKAYAPSFRYFALADAVGGMSAAKSWGSVCQNDAMPKVLEHVSRTLVHETRHMTLAHEPAKKADGAPVLEVVFVQPDGEKVALSAAKRLSQTCRGDSVCPEDSVCGRDGSCYGDGWVYIPPAAHDPQPRLALSGKIPHVPGTTISVRYMAKPR